MTARPRRVAGFSGYGSGVVNAVMARPGDETHTRLLDGREQRQA